ncbi:hypothetical protein [Polyangium fumosum]|uniref:hypothetical protein n=1 Tax=Polyangium fumosum TaxID=889272 RepID=UPI0014795697|nr:hypothetical protein [Polyangium fumosum]
MASLPALPPAAAPAASTLVPAPLMAAEMRIQHLGQNNSYLNRQLQLLKTEMPNSFPARLASSTIPALGLVAADASIGDGEGYTARAVGTVAFGAAAGFCHLFGWHTATNVALDAASGTALVLAAEGLKGSIIARRFAENAPEASGPQPPKPAARAA